MNSDPNNQNTFSPQQPLSGEVTPTQYSAMKEPVAFSGSTNTATGNQNYHSGTFQSTNQHSQQNTSHMNQSTKPSSENLTRKRTSVGHRVQNMLRTLGILFVLLLLIISSLIAYIIIFPNSVITRFAIDNTPFHNIFSLKQNQNGETATFQGVKPGNVFFGLEEDNPSSQQSTVKLVSQTLPSVLSIRVSDQSSNRLKTTADGTGYVVSSNGLVVTNRHVVSKACNSKNPITITAQDANANAFELDLLSIDPVDDIAILKIRNPNDKISPVVIGDSDKLLLGEDVVAIGNVLGQLNNTVTRGIVSGVDRTLETGLVDECTNTAINAEGLIQTDAAINRGNSGGPLFDASGQLVGMNTFGTTEAQSVGFAIPSSSIIYAIRSFNDNGKIIRPRLGVYTQVITPIDKEELSWLPIDYGEIITAPTGSQAIAPGSSAAQAGLREGDIVIAVNGEKVQYAANNRRPLRKLLSQYKPNQEITLTVRKIKDTTGTVPEYESENKDIKLTLGGISYENFAKTQ